MSVPCWMIDENPCFSLPGWLRSTRTDGVLETPPGNQASKIHTTWKSNKQMRQEIRKGNGLCFSKFKPGYRAGQRQASKNPMVLSQSEREQELGVVVGACDLNPWQGGDEAGRSPVQGQPGCHKKVPFQKKRKRETTCGALYNIGE